VLTRVTPAAAGGAWPYANHPAQGAPETGSQGGNLGGQAVGTIAVSPDGPIRPGDVLYIEVGQVGQPANDGTDNYDCSWAIPGFLTCGPVAGPASFNGGGAGGGENDAGTIGGGGSGGGASDVRLCPRSNLCTTGHVSSLASRLIVAGGAGGGFAGQYLPDGRMAAGGAGPGGSGGSPPGGGSGKGGSLTSGGVGGYQGIDAGNGALGQGGDGVGGGRGGGGGYYGGGAGDGSYHAFAAGGGGSNYIPPGRRRPSMATPRTSPSRTST